ncbi:hypothetical protein LZ30DRAFT_744119 [Colletotrichum cereale]|nr:hypothetical protein LZ30DRAFT_744119 [Colletotrichum cereale]
MQPGAWHCSAASRLVVPGEAPGIVRSQCSCGWSRADCDGRGGDDGGEKPGNVVVLLRCILLPSRRISLSSACFFRPRTLDGTACDVPLGSVARGTVQCVSEGAHVGAVEVSSTSSHETGHPRRCPFCLCSFPSCPVPYAVLHKPEGVSGWLGV